MYFARNAKPRSTPARSGRYQLVALAHALERREEADPQGRERRLGVQDEARREEDRERRDEHEREERRARPEQALGEAVEEQPERARREDRARGERPPGTSRTASSARTIHATSGGWS